MDPTTNAGSSVGNEGDTTRALETGTQSPQVPSGELVVEPPLVGTPSTNLEAGGPSQSLDHTQEIACESEEVDEPQPPLVRALMLRFGIGVTISAYFMVSVLTSVSAQRLGVPARLADAGKPLHDSCLWNRIEALGCESLIIFWSVKLTGASHARSRPPVLSASLSPVTSPCTFATLRVRTHPPIFKC